ncbi:hypothetical protein HHX47_DHR2000965 [Lentinula edodes]|nr:hypothetical protein HHX47_DHR2000965 [Lentinula edodes]
MSLSRFDVDPGDLSLLQTLTGIANEKELEEHISVVQNKANRTHYFWMWDAAVSTYQKISYLLAQLLTSVIVGNALRKVVADGWPAENTIGIDLHKDSFPAGFIGGDIFDDTILAPIDDSDTIPNLNLETVDLHHLTFLTPLRRRVSAIYACNVFHLFTVEKQSELAKRLAYLLMRKPGSVIFGSHGVVPAQRAAKDVGPNSFHSAKSFAEMWSEVFEAGSVEISWKIKVRPQKRLSVLGEWDIIWWSVTCI